MSLLLIAASLGLGCRKAVTPNIDRNRPPETWITAAPLDTIGGRGIDAVPGTIPFRFHLYWAGSDPDGAVAGFFFAVTETTAVGLPGEGIPPIPSPKPRDYKYTTRTDSTFIFTVSEGQPDRQHGFFIYAVDNEGKVDATPARFIFNALDKAPPIPIFLKAEARGTVYTIGPGGQVAPVPFARGPAWQPGMAGSSRHLDDIQSFTSFPRDTVPSGSAFDFEWSHSIQAFGTFVTNYKYKFTEVDFVTVPASVTRASYPYVRSPGDTAKVPPGTHVFTLRALDQAMGSTDSTRRVVVNFAPDTWFSGPDTLCAAAPGSGFTRRVNPGGKPYYYIALTGTNRFPGSDPFNLPSVEIPCSYLGPAGDGNNPGRWVNTLYADRPPRKTFFEWWEDTLFVRAEGDTVHKNSVVLFPTGGLDKDSPHVPLVSPTAPPGVVPQGPNTAIGPPNGSPVGFSGRVIVAQDPNRKGFLRPAESLTYPDYRIGTPFYRPIHVLRELARSSGYAYARIRAVDGDGAKDNRITQQVDLADRVDANPAAASPYERDLRTKILTFYVNRSPFLLTQPLDFSPRANATYTGYTQLFNIYAWDWDPALIGEQTEPGRRGQNMVLRKRVSFVRDSAGVEARSVPSAPFVPTQVLFNVPSYWPAGPCQVEIELCDCQFCESNPGEGRCVTFRIPIQWTP